MNENTMTNAIIHYLHYHRNMTTFDVKSLHVKALLKKGLITEVESNTLNALIDENGIDPLFLQSLKIAATETI